MSLGLPNCEDVNDIFLELIDTKKFKICIEDLRPDFVWYDDSTIPANKRHLIGKVCINRIEFDDFNEPQINYFSYTGVARVVSTNYDVSHKLKHLIITRY
jgi:hypothetical protein